MPRKKKERRARGEGSVHFSASKGCWIWRAITSFKPGGGVAYTEGRARTQAAALAAKKKAEKENRLPGGDQATVGEYLDYWLEVTQGNVRAGTWASYERCARLHLKPHIGGFPLKRLDTRAVNRLWAMLGKGGMSAGNVRKCSEVLASCLEHAVSEGEIGHAPTRSAVKPTVVKEPIEVFTDDEVKLMLDAAKGDRLEALYVLAVATGMRQGELLALEDSDVDLEDGSVHVRRSLDNRKGGFQINPPKSRAGVRIVGLPKFAIEALRVHLEGRAPGPLFTTTTGNYIAKSNFVRKQWQPLLEVAGVSYRKFHTIRHTHASRLLVDGVDPAEVARRIGDTIETLMRSYAHWMKSQGRDTGARVDAIYGRPGPRLASIGSIEANSPVLPSMTEEITPPSKWNTAHCELAKTGSSIA